MAVAGNIGLTDAKLKGIKPPAEGRAEYPDDKVLGLRLRVSSKGTKTFILRKRQGARVHNITLGTYGLRFGLADARKKARTLLSDLEAGKAPPPPTVRSQGTSGTIRAMMPAYLASKAHLRSMPDLKSAVNLYILPEFGDRLPDTITRAEITRFIAEIAETKTTRARLVLAQLSAFYSWALPRLENLPANPCRDAGRPAKPKARERVLTEDELRALWAVAEAEALPWGPALKLLLLTGARREEVFAADLAEFNMKAQEWIIPAERAKNGQPHIVPLSDAALAVLKAIPAVEGSGKLFPARTNLENGPSGYSRAQSRFRASLDKVLEREAGPHWTLHDIRRTVATGLQRLGVRFEVTEAVLNHVSGAKGGIAGVYQRHDWKAEKRTALDAWSRELERIVARRDDSNVARLGSA